MWKRRGMQGATLCAVLLTAVPAPSVTAAGSLKIAPTDKVVVVRSTPVKIAWKVTGLDPRSSDPCWVSMDDPDGHQVGNFVYLRADHRSERGATTLRRYDLTGPGMYELEVVCEIFSDTAPVRLRIAKR